MLNIDSAIALPIRKPPVKAATLLIPADRFTEDDYIQTHPHAWVHQRVNQTLLLIKLCRGLFTIWDDQRRAHLSQPLAVLPHPARAKRVCIHLMFGPVPLRLHTEATLGEPLAKRHLPPAVHVPHFQLVPLLHTRQKIGWRGWRQRAQITYGDCLLRLLAVSIPEHLMPNSCPRAAHAHHSRSEETATLSFRLRRILNGHPLADLETSA
mmetsp:Transcript_73828/g.123336  ORF Transcript_73828/g.123336 Transcript_73828/m.123336 type:complete len:209 (+) Transcript_73828:146-772(+)